MKGSLTVPAERFTAAVKWAAKFVANRPVVPVHAALRLVAEDGHLSILGYNEHLTARAVVPYEGEATGQTAVSGRLLAALAGTFGKKAVTIVADEDETITMRVGTWEGTLPCMPVDDFPAPPVAGDEIGTIVGDVLATAVRRAAVAGAGIDQDGAPIASKGMHLRFAPDGLTVITCDRYRAARTIAAGTFGQEAEALAWGSPFAEVAESFAGPDPVHVALGPTTIGLASPTRAVIMNLLGGEVMQAFPLAPVRLFFTEEHPEHAVIRVGDLSEPMKRAALMQDSTNSKHPGLVRVRFTEGSMVVNAESTEIKKRSDEVIEADYSGADCEFLFNPSYFGDALSSAPGGKVDIALTPGLVNGKPVKVLLTVPGDNTWHHVLMPIKK